MTASRGTIIFGRMFRDGFRNLARNIWLTTAATAVMAVTLGIILISGVINLSLTETIDNRTTDFAVSIYFKPSPDELLLDSMRRELDGKEYVASINYISEEQAIQNFIERENSEALRSAIELSGQPLPSSFEVHLNDLSYVDAVIELANEGVYSQIFDRTGQTDITKKSAEQYLQIRRSSNKVTLVAVGVFAVISALIVFNTIRMAVFSRSREIEIMKLIGATKRYIRGPFLVEAVLYGLIAGLVAFWTVFSLVYSLLPKISSIKSDETVEFIGQYWYLLLSATLLVGALIGFVSSWLATEKYLKFKRW